MADFGMEEKIAEIARPVVEHLGLELVDVEYRREPGGWVLRLYIDREGGVTLDECGSVSAEVGAAIEIEELIDHHYSLEVSSPGLTRPLKKKADFERFKGRLVKLKFYAAVNGRKTVVGINMGIEGEEVVVDLEGEKVVIDYGNISKANLELSREE